jgi:hypothetical protein
MPDLKNFMNWVSKTAFISFLALSPNSHAEGFEDYAPSGALNLYWACQFDSATETATQLPCSDLEHYFFDANSKEVSQVTNIADSDIQVSITERTRPGNLRRYYISFVASERFETPPITLPWIDIADSVSLQNRRTALQNRILSGVRLYQTTLTDGVPLPGPETEGKPFYFDAGLTGSGSSAGDVKSTNISNTYSATFFPRNERFRFDLNASGTWVSQTIPSATGAVKGNLFAPDVSVTGIYSVDRKKKWSVAIITDNGAATGANMRNYEGFQAGIEYILVPFLTDQPRQISIRAGASRTQINLVTPNSLDHLNEKLMAAFAQIVYVNQFAQGKMNFSANAKVQFYPGYRGFNQYSGGATVGYRIGRRVVLNGTATYQQMKKSFTYPGTLDYSNPAQLLFLGNAPGRNYTYKFGATLTLGRTSKRVNDRRWAK